MSGDPIGAIGTAARRRAPRASARPAPGTVAAMAAGTEPPIEVNDDVAPADATAEPSPHAGLDGTDPAGGTWGGTTAAQRAVERRARLLDAAFRLLDEDESAVTVRAVLRTAGLNPRYFYESFTDLDDLLAALHDEQALLLAARLEADLAATEAADPADLIRTGIEAVLRHLTEDPRRARVLISGWPGNATLGRRRKAGFLGQIQMYRSDDRLLGGAGADLDDDRLAVFSTMFAGSMGALADAWADGRLGDDLDAVVDRSVELATALFDALTAPRP